jgi:siderophore synthetase component
VTELPALADVGPEAWREANRRLLAKAIGEFHYEGILTAREMATDPPHSPSPFPLSFELPLSEEIRYTFAARPSAFGSLLIRPDSVRRHAAGLLGNRSGAPAWDARQFIVDAGAAIGTDPATLAGYLAEVTATLAADALVLARGGPSAADLRSLDNPWLEGALGGHPWIVANKGRTGFSAADARRYAPEAQRPLRLRWLAVHRGLAEFRGTPNLSEHAVRQAELGDGGTLDRFTERLTGAGLDPDAYVFTPAHPWQWEHAIQPLFAGEVAARRIVPLGGSDDEYLPQQSIRTVTNLTRRHRYDVKLPLRILNTSVWRGIPPHCSLGAPVITQWLHGLLGADEFLTGECRAVFLGEVASVTVRHPYLSEVDGAPYQYLETLGCIWREPVAARAEPGERVRTLASLLHVDPAGRAFVAELVAASGRPAEEWLRALFGALLVPVVYLLHAYGITFNPHGQNALIGFDGDELPTRLFLKDFIDDVELSDVDVPARGPEPDGHAHVLPRKPPELIRQHVVDSVLVGHFRYLAPLCAEQLGVPERTFWSLAAETVRSVQRRFSDDATGRNAYDLLVPEFPRYRLNADRLLVTRYADQAQRHALRSSGTVPNALLDRR